MRAVRDPEGAELAHLTGVCELTGNNVVEIGCGDGKFVWQYASLPKRLVGIDTELEDLCTAKSNKTDAWNSTHFVQADGERLPFPSGFFDIVIFASSL